MNNYLRISIHHNTFFERTHFRQKEGAFVILGPRLKAYCKGKYDNMINTLGQTEWVTEYGDMTGTECIKHLMEKYVKLEDEAVPKIMPKDYNEPWMKKLWQHVAVNSPFVTYQMV